MVIMKKLFLILFAVLLLASCTAEPVNLAHIEEPSGFFMGLWHGIIVVFSFIGSLFSDSIAIYEVNNTGGWYDLGFIMGIGAFSGGSASKL